MLWLAIHLPSLPLEVFGSHKTDQAFVVLESIKNRSIVTHCNQSALKQGVEIGMNSKLAQSLCEQIHIQDRELKREQRQLHNLANYLYRFSPYIYFYNNSSVHIEISSTLKLFKGLNKFIETLEKDIYEKFTKEQALSIELRLASNPELAFLSCYLPAKSKDHIYKLQDLAQLDIHSLEFKQSNLDSLSACGIQSIQDLIKIPNSQIKTQIDSDDFKYLKRLKGQNETRVNYYEPPKYFEDSFFFIEEIENTQQVLFPIKRCIQNLSYYLHSRQLSALKLNIELSDNKQRQTPYQEKLQLRFAKGQHQAKEIMNLLRLQLENFELQQPIHEIKLSCQDFCERNQSVQDLFPGELKESSSGSADTQLIDQFRARMGDNCIKGIQLKAEHRPELAMSYGEIQTKNNTKDQIQQHQHFQHSSKRPFWLLSTPRPLNIKKRQVHYFGPLSLINDAERIETGWWDTQFIKRDYFIARHPKGEYYWIFQDHLKQGAWFLHGIFS